MVAVEGTVTHPLLLSSWREGAIVLEWDGDTAPIPCEQNEGSEEGWTTSTEDWNSSSAGQPGLPGLRWTEDSGMERWNSSSIDQLLESHGLAIAGNSLLYLAKPGQLSDEGLLLCLGEMRINLTLREGDGCEGRDSEWCSSKVLIQL